MFRPALAALSVAGLLAACGDDTPEVAEDAQETTEVPPVIAEDNPEEIPPEVSEVEPEAAEESPEAAEAEPEIVEVEPEVVEAEPEAGGAALGAAEEAPEAAGGEPEVVEAEPEVLAAEPEVAEGASAAGAGSEPQVVEIEPEPAQEGAAATEGEPVVVQDPAEPGAQDAAIPEAAPERTQAEPVFTVESAADLDEYLLDPGGRPAYLFSTDTPAADGQPPVVTCSEECRTIWPLVVTSEPPVAGEGVDASKLEWWEEGPVPGLVTYDGWPLYHFERDDPDAPPHGHGRQSYGGQWLLMGAEAPQPQPEAETEQP